MTLDFLWGGQRSEFFKAFVKLRTEFIGLGVLHAPAMWSATWGLVEQRSQEADRPLRNARDYVSHARDQLPRGESAWSKMQGIVDILTQAIKSYGVYAESMQVAVRECEAGIICLQENSLGERKRTLA